MSSKDSKPGPRSISDRIQLLDGNSIPVLGLGVYESTNEQVLDAVQWALEAGYRLIDSAEWYENEEATGKAIREFLVKHSDVRRKEITYTTKLMTNRNYDNTLSKIQDSLRLCGLDYIDVYLLHSPIGGAQVRRACWEACLEAKKRGWVKTVGVSNWSPKHIEEIVRAGLELPALNQCDFHPYCRRKELVKYCQEKGILLEAWAPLARAYRMDEPTLVAVAKKHNKSPAQVLIRWSLQMGFLPIPKSVSKYRVVENGDVFDFALDDEDMKQLNDLDENLITDWDMETLD